MVPVFGKSFFLVVSENLRYRTILNIGCQEPHNWQTFNQNSFSIPSVEAVLFFTSFEQIEWIIVNNA